MPESKKLKDSFVGVGSELARGRSSVEEVKSGREGLLRGRDQDLGTIAFPGEGGRGLERPEDLVPAAAGWQSWFRPRAMVLAFAGLELRGPCWDRAHLGVFPVLMSWVSAWVPVTCVILRRGWCLLKAEKRRWMRPISGLVLGGPAGGGWGFGASIAACHYCALLVQRGSFFAFGVSPFSTSEPVSDS